MLLAYRCALACTSVTARGVEATEFPGLAGRHGVHAVPAVVVADRSRWTGNIPERVFVDRLLAVFEG